MSEVLDKDKNESWGGYIARIVGGVIGVFIAVGLTGRRGIIMIIGFLIGGAIGQAIGEAIGGGGKGKKSTEKKDTTPSADTRSQLQQDSATTEHQYHQMPESSKSDKRNLVSEDESGIEFCCPHCGQTKTVSKAFIGLYTRCPSCNKTYSTADARNQLQ